MGTIFLHEIAGTAILLLLGVGVVANVVLAKNKLQLTTQLQKKRVQLRWVMPLEISSRTSTNQLLIA